MRSKLVSLLVGAGFFLTSGATVAVLAILVAAPVALFMSGDRPRA